MSDKKHHEPVEVDVVEKAKGFWEKYSKTITIASTAVILLVGGFLAYKYLVQVPNEEKAREEIYRAEENFRKDSFALALNGSGTTPGFLKVISKYSGTRTADLANYYAGVCYLHTGDYNNAVKYLSSANAHGAKQLEAKIEGLMGDAKAELKKNDEAIAHYKKAGTIFEQDQALSSEYLFRAGLLLEMNGKTKEAIEMYQTVKDKYPRSEKGFLVEKYLARLGSTRS